MAGDLDERDRHHSGGARRGWQMPAPVAHTTIGLNDTPGRRGQRRSNLACFLNDKHGPASRIGAADRLAAQGRLQLIARLTGWTRDVDVHGFALRERWVGRRTFILRDEREKGKWEEETAKAPGTAAPKFRESIAAPRPG